MIITLGQTRVLCAVSIENRVPRFLRGTGAGWVTAEYAMLPRATNTRSDRESMRTGRSLRAVTDLDILGERTFTVDCDVLQADGGTRTAAITGGYVALHHAMQRLVTAGEYASVPLRMPVAATSVGVVQGAVLLDLCYEEDSGADVDLNVVKTGDGEYIEVQGTAEGSPFARRLLNEMLDVADAGLEHLFEVQRRHIAAATAS